MINFNNVNNENNIFSAKRIFGKIVRLPLKIIPKNLPLPILQGPGRGLKWIVGSYNHSCWMGFYEFEKQVLLSHLVSEGDTVFDIGAHVGYFSIIFANLVGKKGMVYAFEPLEQNCFYIREHILLNKISNINLVQSAVGIEDGFCTFEDGSHSATGKKSSSGRHSVIVTDLLSFMIKNSIKPPKLIKMDIEGEELNVVPHLLGYMKENNTSLLLSTHSDFITENLSQKLKDNGFEVTGHQWSNLPQKRTLENSTLLLATPGQKNSAA